MTNAMSDESTEGQSGRNHRKSGHWHLKEIEVGEFAPISQLPHRLSTFPFPGSGRAAGPNGFRVPKEKPRADAARICR